MMNFLFPKVRLPDFNQDLKFELQTDLPSLAAAESNVEIRVKKATSRF